MSRWFYPRLAISNIRKNSQTYFPYILTAIGTVMMFYIIAALANSYAVADVRGGRTLHSLLTFGSIVVGLFAIIFLFYTNSFLIKRRKKEIGLYNILGMEKKHIARMLFLENLFVAAIAIALGIVCGVLFSKLVMLALFKILGLSAPMGFEVSVPIMIITALLFGTIFTLTLVSNLRQIHLSKPIELLRGGQIGEREPKTKWLIALMGFVTLGTGYYIAQTTGDPINAIKMFFIAVVLVMIGTYCLFTAGSIWLLKVMRRNKHFYYHPRRFTNVSGMIYRMKKNAVGLANICILSTMVLVTISTTVSLYVGLEDVLRARYPRNVMVTVDYTGDAVINTIQSTIADLLEEHSLEPKNAVGYRYLSFAVAQHDNQFITDRSYTGPFSVSMLYFIPVSDYNRLTNQAITLGDDEALLYVSRTSYPYDTLTVCDRTFTIKAKLDDFLGNGTNAANIYASYFLIVKDMNVVNAIYQEQIKAYEEFASNIKYFAGFDMDSSFETGVALHRELKAKLNQALGNSRIFTLESAAEAKDDFLSLYGGLFFLGIFLGLLFVLAAILIIYYKQITEGYDDQQRYQIMQKVGMSQEEVKQTIKMQVLMVFFIPLLMAAIHVGFAFKVITLLLAIFNLTNIALFAWCTVATLVIFGVFYALVYLRTARVYYRIVSLSN